MSSPTVIYPPSNSIAEGDVGTLRQVESSVQSGLTHVFGLACGAQWKQTDKSENDRYFTLYALTEHGEVSLGEFSVSFLSKATKDDIDSRFNSELSAVQAKMEESQATAKPI